MSTHSRMTRTIVLVLAATAALTLVTAAPASAGTHFAPIGTNGGQPGAAAHFIPTMTGGGTPGA